MQAAHPTTLTTLSTHDTKRADDVRARLAVLSENPVRWKSALNRWSRANAPFRTGKYPDRNSEYFLYQTMIGAWPIDKDRLTAYMEKAMREAKRQTSWTQQNREYEEALGLFIERILDSNWFIAELESFVNRILYAGRINGLSQTLLRYTVPGVPDTYQGSELWDLSLVDPDNRRPVDYALRSRILSELGAGMSIERIMESMDSGTPKLWVAHTALCVRRDHPEWFGADAAYQPVLAEGPKREHLVGFLRGDRVAVFAPHLPLKLGSNWASNSIELSRGKWFNRLTRETFAGGSIRVQSLLQRFPVALLTREED